MFPFPRKKPEQDIEVKDLKPKNKRKRKEPVTPWSHKERIFLFIVLLFTIIASIIFAVRSHDAKLAKLSSPLSNTSQLVQNVIAKPTLDTAVLQKELSAITQNLTGTYGIWVEDVSGSYTLGVSDKASFDGASLFKLPLMLAYYQAVDAGSLDPNTTYSLKASDAASGAGSLANMAPGTVLTYRDIVSAMGKNSDNTAFQIMGNILGWSKIDAVLTQINMSDTSFDDSMTTPYDIGLLFAKLSKGELISNSSKAEFLTFLTNTSYEDYIPKGIPDDIRIAHKFATDDGELNDAGIVYSTRPFILVILAKDIDFTEARTAFPQIAQTVFDWSTK